MNQRDGYQPPAKESLKREISLLGSTALAFNGLIGAGIFMLPGAAAAKIGLFSPYAFMICAILMLPVFLSFAEAASRVNTTGGAVEYTREAFGPFTSFVTGWLAFFAGATALSANTNALVVYLGSRFEFFAGGFGHYFAIGVICASLTLINVLGVKQGVKALYIFGVAKILPLTLLIGIGLYSYFGAPTTPATGAFPDVRTWSETLILIFYAFVGFEGSVVTAGESAKPKRDMPRALLITLVSVSSFYFLLQWVTASTLVDPLHSKAPLADVAGILMGPWGTSLLIATAIVSIAGNLSSSMLAVPRYSYAMSLQKLIPSKFSELHPRYKTPYVSILFLGGLVFTLASTGSFIWLAGVTSLARLIIYALCILSIPKLRKKSIGDQEAWRLPFAIPLLGLATCAFLVYQVSGSAWIFLLTHVTIGVVIYFSLKKSRAKDAARAVTDRPSKNRSPDDRSVAPTLFPLR